MLVAAAVCPHPPLLVDELAGAAVGELTELRDACDRAVRMLLATRPQLLLAVGTGERDGRFGARATGSFARFGRDVRVGFTVRPHRGARARPSNRPAGLPLSLAVAGYLLGGRTGRTRVAGRAVAAAATPAACLAAGRRWAATGRVAMLVCGDGSARRGERAPGWWHPRAAEFDQTVAAALRDGDPGRLAGLDAGLADELLVAGRAAWQVLAGAATGRAWTGRLTYDSAPYGVGYLVAEWRPRSR